jgi:hypothetical protein
MAVRITKSNLKELFFLWGYLMMVSVLRLYGVGM